MLTELLKSKGVIAVCFWLLGFLSRILLESRSQNRLFDHRLKLEKEYSLYGELWERLFELRRDLGAMLQSIQNGEPPDLNLIAQRHDAFQAVFRRNEPFIAKQIYTRSREIAARARKIHRLAGKAAKLESSLSPSPGSEADDLEIDRTMQLEDNNVASFKKIEKLCEDVSKEIRRRVCVP